MQRQSLGNGALHGREHSHVCSFLYQPTAVELGPLWPSTRREWHRSPTLFGPQLCLGIHGPLCQRVEETEETCRVERRLHGLRCQLHNKYTIRFQIDPEMELALRVVIDEMNERFTGRSVLPKPQLISGNAT